MSLADKLRARAPLRLDHYMETCLFDPDYGYYSTRDVFGTQGDFITAPEISQIFGEMVGMWVLGQWQRLGAPSAFAFIELGAGRGVLMRDVLRVLNAIPECRQAAKVHIVEKSDQLRKLQKEAVGDVVFLDSLSELPNLPTIVISNEFFDALPIRQFRFEDGGWLEAYLSKDFTKTWQPCRNPPKALARHMQSGQISEYCEAGVAFAGELGAHIATQKGAMLHCDYGEWEGTGDTFQALYQHKYVDPFSHFGEADLTAHVRFSDLANAAQLDANFMTQGEFLQAMGAKERLDALIEKNPSRGEDLRAGYARLTSDDQMGKLFKTLTCEA